MYRRSWLGSDPAGGHHWGCARRPLPAGGRAAGSRPERPESHDGRAIVRGTCRVQRPGCWHHPRPSPLLFSGCPRAEPPRTPRPSQTPRAGPPAIPPLPALHTCLSRSRPAAPGTARGQEEARGPAHRRSHCRTATWDITWVPCPPPGERPSVEARAGGSLARTGAAAAHGHSPWGQLPALSMYVAPWREAGADAVARSSWRF